VLILVTNTSPEPPPLLAWSGLVVGTARNVWSRHIAVAQAVHGDAVAFVGRATAR